MLILRGVRRTPRGTHFIRCNCVVAASTDSPFLKVFTKASTPIFVRTFTNRTRAPYRRASTTRLGVIDARQIPARASIWLCLAMVSTNRADGHCSLPPSSAVRHGAVACVLIAYVVQARINCDVAIAKPYTACLSRSQSLRIRPEASTLHRLACFLFTAPSFALPRIGSYRFCQRLKRLLERICFVCLSVGHPTLACPSTHPVLTVYPFVLRVYPRSVIQDRRLLY